MALNIPFCGSGHFAVVRDWSCPVHDYDVNYSEDYDSWETPGEICLDCETGHWVDRKDADGNVVMREIGAWEWMLLEQTREMFALESPLLCEMMGGFPNPDAKITWVEDNVLPRITS